MKYKQVIYELVLRKSEKLLRYTLKTKHVSSSHSYLYTTANSVFIQLANQRQNDWAPSFYYIKYKFYSLIFNTKSMKHRLSTRCNQCVFQRQMKVWQYWKPKHFISLRIANLEFKKSKRSHSAYRTRKHKLFKSDRLDELASIKCNIRGLKTSQTFDILLCGDRVKPRS